MATRVQTAIFRHLDELRWEPTEKRVRAVLAGAVVADTTEAQLVWEPRRVVPTYAVPVASLTAELAPARPADAADLDEVGLRLAAVSDRPVLDPSIPFTVHTAEGDPVEVRSDGEGGSSSTASKGEAAYWSPVVRGEAVPDLAWSYPDPLHDAIPVSDRICFFDERLDLTVDGVRRERPVTPWS